MSGTRGMRRAGAVLLALWALPASGGEEPAPIVRDALVARLVRPDLQAEAFLSLFEGARWPDPAAALVAWKKGARRPNGLGKPLEAAIAIFNPEMVREWRVLDGAELRVGLDPTTAAARWYAIIPRDDGTLSAALTASRVTYPDDPPVAVDGREVPVARLGRSGLPVGCQVGRSLVVGGSRDDLLRGASARHVNLPTPPATPGSGIVFSLEPGKLVGPRDAPLGLRRAIEALHAAGCRRVEGIAALEDGRLALDATTTIDRGVPGDLRPIAAAVEPAWLDSLPRSGAMAMIAVAIDPSAGWLDRACELADRVERVDPARAGLAPLRTRLNLLAAAAGLNLDADLWPHLRGLSACVVGDPARPGRPTGALVVLHLDEPSTARAFLRDSLPRVGRLLGRRAGGAGGGDGRHAGAGDGGDPTPGLERIATVAGRPVTAWRRDRDVWVSWCDEAIAAAWIRTAATGRPPDAALSGWAAEGRKAPQRVLAFWPGRWWAIGGGPEPPAAMLHALTDDPPVTWWGWSEGGRERDLVRWAGLGRRVRGLLEAVPVEPVEG